ncbi:MAG: enhanced entry protein EnhB [Gammaproteobacteria bacterium]|nr:enhanced entry protein EnhB [Gammaproteobacteria bacterium]
MSIIMYKNKQLLSFLVLSTALTAVHAFPKGCEVTGFSFSNGQLIVNDSGKQTYFLVQNTASDAIEFSHNETNPDIFMSPKLESKIAANQWSAFASDIQNFNFSCQKTDMQGNKTTINCADVLQLCQYPRAQFPLSNKGNYWISTNKEISLVIKESVSKGIYLKW